LTATAGFQLPLVIPAGATLVVPVDSSFPVPDAPGVYTFRASIPALGVGSAARVVEVRNTILSTSIDAPHLLAAIYSSPAVGAPIVVTGGEPVDVDIGATNIGEALWLARADHDRGVVRLGWQWTKNGHKFAEGRAPIPHDVFPGQSYRFQVTVNAPNVPGSYALEVGLVSELVAWFADLGVQPLKLMVKVRPASDVPFAALLQRRRSLEADAPSLALSTLSSRHRAGEVLQLRVSVSNEKRPWFVDAYLVLEGPEGALWFHDGQRLVPYRKEQWPQLANGVQLRTGTRLSVALSLPLTGIMPGAYRWYLVLTDAGSERVITDSQTSLEVAW